MVTIWKYNVPGHCEGRIKQVLNVKMQYGKPVVYVMLDDSVDTIRALDFYTVGTGWELTDGDERIIQQSAYIGTVKDEEGYMWHVFCVPVEPVGDKLKEKDNAGAAADQTIDNPVYEQMDEPEPVARG